MHATNEPVEWCPMVRMIESSHKESSIAQIGDKWCEISVDPVINDKGILIGAVHIITDITERKEVERELKESEENYRTLFESSKDGIVFTTMDGKIQNCNHAFLDMLGYTLDEIQEKTYKQLTPEKWHEMEDDIYINRFVPTGYTGEFEKEYIRKDGTIVPVSINVWLIKDEYGNDNGLWGIVKDITERKKAEQELKFSEEKYRLLFNNSPVGIGLTTIDGRVLDSNDALVKLTGFSTEDLNKIGASSIYADQNQRSEILKLLKTSGKLRDYEVKLRRKDNTEFFGSVSFDLIELRGEKIIQTSLRDITKSKEAELELIKLSNLKSELLRRTSHELKTPLVSIKGFSDLLLDLHREKLDDYVVSTLNQIRKGCIRLEYLISDILNAAELESGTIQARKSEEDLSFLIKFCVKELKGLSELRKQIIKIEILEPLVILIEKEEIHKVISNILSNAIKYTPPYGTIKIRSEIQDDFIVISVKDNGIGFTEEEKSRIFKQFGKIERYGQGMDIISEGSGLGLYISKKIIELHGGKIWVESEGSKKGSTFYFSLPLIEKF
jgi:PAS domain S-box-containing protein